MNIVTISILLSSLSHVATTDSVGLSNLRKGLSGLTDLGAKDVTFRQRPLAVYVIVEAPENSCKCQNTDITENA